MLKHNIYLPGGQKAYKNTSTLFYQHVNKNEADVDALCRKKFSILDGPPYANGEIHIGHIVNRLLKQIITLAQKQIGKSATLKVNWDCHGLPIELAVLKFNKLNKNVEFVCKVYALNWIKTQIAQLKLVGLRCYKPSTSMCAKVHMLVLNKLYKLIKNNYIAYGKKSVMWSLSDNSSVSENDVKQEHTKIRMSDTLNVMSARKQTQKLNNNTIIKLITGRLNRQYRFLGKMMLSVCSQTWLLPWTTCISLPSAGGLKIHNNTTITTSRTKLFNTKQIKLTPNVLLSALAAWCIFNKKRVPVANWQSESIQVVNPAIKSNAANKLVHSYAWQRALANATAAVAQKEIYIVNKLILCSLVVRCYNKLVAVFRSSRSNSLVINWISRQLYIKLNSNTKGKIIKAADSVRFKPEIYKTILTNLIQTRPDWTISRQRRWGIPLCLIINSVNKTILDENLKQRIEALLYHHKQSQWYKCKMLYNRYSKQNWRKLNGVVDIWFDASSIYSLKESKKRWDLVIEGIDQHRGWFQSMLINSALTTGAAPVKTIMTHGFVMWNPVQKLSKSLPSKRAQTLFKTLTDLNANVARIWVCSIRSFENQVIKANWLLKARAVHFKINNTLKWGLDVINSVSKRSNINQNFNTIAPINKLVLHKLKLQGNRMVAAYKDYNLNKAINIIVATCDPVLSAYFNIMKDQVYCDFNRAQNRLDSISVLRCAILQLVTWLTPVAPALCYEFKTKLKASNNVINKLPDRWFSKRIASNWRTINSFKKLISSLRFQRGTDLAELCVNVYVSDARALPAFKNVNLSLVFGCAKVNVIWVHSYKWASVIKLSKTQSISIWKTKLKRCVRCRRLLYANEY
ncbi:Isoleucine--tRNA ligase [Candidatus Hodgkinia cicadicola]|nr:Isoleucine--tRNA ligase [Candidatus Hodgkinia cicadicola]